MTTLLWGAATDVGRTRKGNEDSYFAGERVFAVADGLGGHRAGEVASAIVVDLIAHVEQAPDPAAALEQAILEANDTIFERAQGDPQTSGMATTVTAVAFNGNVAHLAHVGDSRCYLLRDGALRQMSRDHTLVARLVEEGSLTSEAAETHPQRSVLTRAVGSEPAVAVDGDDVPLLSGDRLMLCSDGLSSVVSEDAIAGVLESVTDPQHACAQLVDQANSLGGPDNITVLIVDVQDVAAAAPQPTRSIMASPGDGRRPKARRLPRRAVAWTAVIAIVLVGSLIGLKAWANRSWYVGVQDGRVAIYKGLPTDFIISLSSVQEQTEIAVDTVAPYYRPRLTEGIRAESLRAARGLVARIPLAPAAALPTPTPTPAATPTPTPTST